MKDNYSLRFKSPPKLLRNRESPSRNYLEKIRTYWRRSAMRINWIWKTTKMKLRRTNYTLIEWNFGLLSKKKRPYQLDWINTLWDFLKKLNSISPSSNQNYSIWSKLIINYAKLIVLRILRRMIPTTRTAQMMSVYLWSLIGFDTPEKIDHGIRKTNHHKKCFILITKCILASKMMT